MAISVTDSSVEGSTISSNPDGESVSAIKPRRSKRLKNASSVVNFLSESEDDLEEVMWRSSPQKKKAKRCLVMLKVKTLLPRDQEKLQKTKPPKKKGKKAVMLEQIESVPLHTLESETELELVKQLQGEEWNMKALYDGVREEMVGDASIMSALMKCHHINFAKLFGKCSKGKERYLRFQIEWHKYCSVFLFSQEHKVESVIPKYDGRVP